MPYVYSTLTADQNYTLYPADADPRQIPKALQTVFIAGGANVVDNHSMVTPRGVVTEVSDEQMKVLEKIPAFDKHRKAGFISIDKIMNAPDEVAKDMTPQDESSQLVDDDFENKPVTNTDNDSEPDKPRAKGNRNG